MRSEDSVYSGQLGLETGVSRLNLPDPGVPATVSLRMPTLGGGRLVESPADTEGVD